MEKTMEGEQATYVIDVLPFIQIGAKAVEEDIDEESDTE